MSRHERRNFEKFSTDGGGWIQPRKKLSDINAENEEEQKLRDELNKKTNDTNDRINPDAKDDTDDGYFEKLNSLITNMNLTGSWDGETPSTKKTKKSVAEGKVTLIQFDIEDSDNIFSKISQIMGGSKIGIDSETGEFNDVVGTAIPAEETQPVEIEVHAVEAPNEEVGGVDFTPAEEEHYQALRDQMQLSRDVAGYGGVQKSSKNVDLDDFDDDDTTVVGKASTLVDDDDGLDDDEIETKEDMEVQAPF